MEADECIRTRSSVRSYKDDPVEDSLVKEVMEAAIQAPSAGNVQDWEFVVVKTPEGKAALSVAAFNQGFISKAPVVIVVGSNLEKIEKAYGERGKALYSIQDTAAASQNLMLAAWNRGLGTCWIGAFNEEAVKEAVVMPTYVRPLAIITMGYPSVPPVKSRRGSPDRVMHWETF